MKKHRKREVIVEKLNREENTDLFYLFPSEKRFPIDTEYGGSFDDYQTVLYLENDMNDIVINPKLIKSYILTIESDVQLSCLQVGFHVYALSMLDTLKKVKIAKIPIFTRDRVRGKNVAKDFLDYDIEFLNYKIGNEDSGRYHDTNERCPVVTYRIIP